MSELTKNVNNLIDNAKVTFEHDGSLITCKITLEKEWLIVTGESHCFDKEQQNIELGKNSAFNRAKSNLYELEAYHLKRSKVDK